MRWLAPIAVGLATALVFSNAAPSAAVHDDKFFVPSRYELDGASLRRMFREDTWTSAGSFEGSYRPLLLLTLAVDRARFGDDPHGYHVTNVLLNALTAILLYTFILALQRRFSAGKRSLAVVSGVHLLAAAGAALLFGVHPIHTEAVDSVFNRSEILATIGIVSALLLILRWETRRPVLAWLSAAVIYVAALLCRESAASLPALAALMLYLLYAGEGWRRVVRAVAPVATMLVPLGVYLTLRHAALTNSISHAPSLSENIAPQTGIFGQLALVVESLREYLRMVLWPHPLRASYEDFRVTALPISLVVLAVAIYLAVALRRRAPLATFGIGFFYLALLPSSRLVTASNLSLSLGGHTAFQPANTLLLAERVVYTPSIGLALAAAAGLAALAIRFGGAAAAAAALALCALLAFVTFWRNEQWHSNTALWEAETRVAPQNGDGWRLLVAAYLQEGRNEDIARVCDRERDRHPKIAQLHNNCGIAYAALGRSEDAEASYRRAIDLGLAAVGHANLGRLLAQRGRIGEAEAEYARAVTAETDPPRRHLRRAQLLLRFHPDRVAEARQELEQALALQPGYGPAVDLLRTIESSATNR
jgi:tetratricopeptide (TPR) repeat protein